MQRGGSAAGVTPPLCLGSPGPAAGGGPVLTLLRFGSSATPAEPSWRFAREGMTRPRLPAATQTALFCCLFLTSLLGTLCSLLGTGGGQTTYSFMSYQAGIFPESALTRGRSFLEA